MYARTGAGPPPTVRFAKNDRLRCGHRLVLGKADAADRTARARDADGREYRLLEADGLEHGVDAEAVGELAHALDRLVAALADDVGRAELSRQRYPGRVAAKDDDLLGAEAPGGDHAAQADGAVTDDGDRLSAADLGDDRSVMGRAHHVREVEKRWHQRVVLGDRQDEQGPVRMGHPEGFGLCSAVPKNPPWTQDVCSPSRQKLHVPSE